MSYPEQASIKRRRDMSFLPFPRIPARIIPKSPTPGHPPGSMAVILSVAKDLRSARREILRYAQDDNWRAGRQERRELTPLNTTPSWLKFVTMGVPLPWTKGLIILLAILLQMVGAPLASAHVAT